MAADGEQGSEEQVIGSRHVKVDAWDRVTGRAAYSADLHLPGTLFGKTLRSPHPHAIIKHINTSKAEQHPGVKAIVTYRDLPPLVDSPEGFGEKFVVDINDLRKLQFAHDKALFEGHAIAAVAATSPEAAEEALDLIEVEYGVLPRVENALDAMKPDAPLLHADLYTGSLGEKPDKPSNIALYLEQGWGDVDRGFEEADVIVEETYDTMVVHHGFLEPQACVARWEADGSVTVCTSTQGTFNTQRMLAALLQVALNRINVVPMEIGGGFGGKVYVVLEAQAILLSRKSGRPVKMVMDRAEVFRANGGGAPLHATIKVGARRDGRIVAAYSRMVMDAGALPGAPLLGPSPAIGAAQAAFGPYRMESFKLEAYDVVTNKPPVLAYRAPGGPPAAFAAECTMDRVAERLGMDPLEFRRINAVEEGDPAYDGRPYSRIGLKELLRRVEESHHWNAPLEGPNRGRGLALSFWMGVTLMSTSTINLNVDGTVEVVTGQVDIAGTRTTMLQMAAHELQIPPEHVTVRMVDTQSASYTDITAGSRTTYTQSKAIANGCLSLTDKMKALAADQLKLDVDDIEYAQGRFWAKGNRETNMTWKEVASRSRYRGGGPISGYGSSGRLKPAPAFAAHLADVEVDPETGKVKLLRYTCFQDVGKAINPTMVEGQMQGGATQGLGWALSEYYHFEEGKLRNPTLLDYRLLTAADLPMLDAQIVEVPASDGPYGARGVGEVPIMPPAAAVANALYRAVAVRMRQLPMTPERVFWVIKAKGRAPKGATAGKRAPPRRHTRG